MPQDEESGCAALTLLVYSGFEISPESANHQGLKKITKTILGLLNTVDGQNPALPIIRNIP